MDADFWDTGTFLYALAAYWFGRWQERDSWTAKADALTAKQAGGKLYRVTRERDRSWPK